jgi:large subunit ribosomal protein L28
MARRCEISGKGAQNGHNVSHSNNKTNKVTYPNLKTKRLFNSETGKWVTVRVSARALRTIDKKGLSAVLRERKAVVR